MPSDAAVTQRAGSRQSMTGLTEADCMALLPHVEHAVVVYLQDRTIDGQPRTSRRYTTYDTSPLPTAADTRLFILTYVKQNPLQEVQGQLFGDVASACEHMDSCAASRVASSLVGPRAASGPYSRRLGRDADDATDRSFCSRLPFFHAGTARPIQRPSDPEDQQEYDRGKKQCHTLKPLLVINATCHGCF